MKDGGPAFPQIWLTNDGQGNQKNVGPGGMTLRDYFAAKAMPKLIERSSKIDDFSVGAKAYQIADAMLNAREQ